MVSEESKGVFERTRCKKPCHYRKYSFIGDMTPTTFEMKNRLTFSLWATSKETSVETEVLVYPLASLVAEFGGTLSLFLGVSFMTLWHGIYYVMAWLKRLLTGLQFKFNYKVGNSPETLHNLSLPS